MLLRSLPYFLLPSLPRIQLQEFENRYGRAAFRFHDADLLKDRYVQYYRRLDSRLFYTKNTNPNA